MGTDLKATVLRLGGWDTVARSGRMPSRRRPRTGRNRLSAPMPLLAYVSGSDMVVTVVTLKDGQDNPVTGAAASR
ncbi:hypothetical protein KCP71_06695 [Salmonella enterica subsp. enterica]|nr:hypothetical protein KCP71_06695 [Salmonella enterica subsp. enterica]